MKHLNLVLASTLAVASTGSVSAEFTPDMSSVLKPVKAVIAAAKSDNPAAISALYSSDAVVVDDRPPFEWTGEAAGAQWLADASRSSKWSRNVASLTTAPADIQISGNDRAYVVMAGQFSSADSKNPWKHDGTLTFTLRKIDAAWKISSQVWAQNFHPQ